jgi:hypothetical protein
MATALLAQQTLVVAVAVEVQTQFQVVAQAAQA